MAGGLFAVQCQRAVVDGGDNVFICVNFAVSGGDEIMRFLIIGALLLSGCAPVPVKTPTPLYTITNGGVRADIIEAHRATVSGGIVYLY